MQKVAYFKDGNKNIEYEIMDKQARDDIAALPKEIIDRITSPFSTTGSVVQCHPVEDYPLGVAVNLNPVQEGSGEPSHDNIRPICGHAGVEVVRCGKNLFPPVTISGSTGFTSDGDGVFKYVGTGNTVIGSYTFKANTEYALSTSHKSGSGNLPCVIVRNPSGNTTGQVSNYGNANNPVHVKFDADTTWNIMFQAQSSAGMPTVGDTYTFQIEAGSVASSHEPHVSVIYPVALGNNLFNADEASAVGNRINIATGAQMTVANTQRASSYIAVEPNTQYILNFSYYSGGDFGMAFYNSSKTYISGTKQNLVDTAEYSDRPFTFTTPENCAYLRFSTSNNPDLSKIILLKGAGVYGGTVNVNEGETVADVAFMELNGAESWTASGTQFVDWVAFNFYPKGKVGNSVWTDVVCNMFRTMLQTDYSTGKNESGGFGGVGGYGAAVTFKVSRTVLGGVTGTNADALDAWKTFLAEQYAAGTPVQIAYKLETPTTITHGAHNIPALNGVNTVYADAGAVTVNGRIDPEYLNNTVLTRLAALEAAAVN